MTISIVFFCCVQVIVRRLQQRPRRRCWAKRGALVRRSPVNSCWNWRTSFDRTNTFHGPSDSKWPPRSCSPRRRYIRRRSSMSSWRTVNDWKMLVNRWKFGSKTGAWNGSAARKPSRSFATTPTAIRATTTTANLDARTIRRSSFSRRMTMNQPKRSRSTKTPVTSSAKTTMMTSTMMMTSTTMKKLTSIRTSTSLPCTDRIIPDHVIPFRRQFKKKNQNKQKKLLIFPMIFLTTFQCFIHTFFISLFYDVIENHQWKRTHQKEAPIGKEGGDWRPFN